MKAIIVLCALGALGCNQILGIDDVRAAARDSAVIDAAPIDASRGPDARVVVDAAGADAAPSCPLDADPHTGCSQCIEYGSDAGASCVQCFTDRGDRWDGSCCHFTCCHPAWPAC